MAADDHDQEGQQASYGESWTGRPLPIQDLLSSGALGCSMTGSILGDRVVRLAMPATTFSAMNYAKLYEPFGGLPLDGFTSYFNSSIASAMQPLLEQLTAPQIRLSNLLSGALVPPSVFTQMQSVVSASVAPLAWATLASLGAAAREAGLEEDWDELSEPLEGLDDVAREAEAAAEEAGLVDVSPQDVGLGVKVAVALLSLGVVLYINTGDDEWRWAVRVLLEWLGLKGAADVAGSWTRRRLTDSPSESGG